MLTAIELDHQPGLHGEEIDDIGTQRHLAAELHILDPPVSKQTPQLLFGIGRALTKLAGAGRCHARNIPPHPDPNPDPLPRSGGEGEKSTA
jgi:hypothetical protein